MLSGGDLSRLVDRAREAGELDARVRALLPEGLGSHVTGAAFHEADGEVVVLVDSSAWASRIRFHAPELVARLAPRYDGAVTRVRVKVRPRQG
ncbi:MAG: DciA family protein [Gammaproteobacteria bacterium]